MPKASKKKTLAKNLINTAVRARGHRGFKLRKEKVPSLFRGSKNLRGEVKDRSIKHVDRSVSHRRGGNVSFGDTPQKKKVRT